MILLRIFCIAIGIVTVLLAACAPVEPETTDQQGAVLGDTVIGDPIIIGHTYSIPSKVLGMERRISVRLPDGYREAKDQTYPVVYVVDGGPEQDFPHIAGIAQSRDINWTFAPFILVGIETVNRRHQIVPPATDIKTYETELGQTPGGSAKFRQFIATEVMPWVEEHTRTNGRKAVMGESLGGLFVIETLFEDPNLFDDYIAITPSLWWEDMKYGAEASDYLRNLPPASRRLYISSADEGYRHQEGIDKLVSALKLHAPNDLKWVYYARGATETHASIYHLAALDAFRTLFPMTTRIGRAGTLLSGNPLLPRTAEHEALIKQKCKVETALHITPLQNLGRAGEANAYKCLVYKYGPVPTSGNMNVLTEADALNQ